MRITTVWCVGGPHGRSSFEIRSEPWWSFLVRRTVEFACAATGHRWWCNAKVVLWSLNLPDRYADSFTIPATDDLLSAYARWCGFDWDILPYDGEEED